MFYPVLLFASVIAPTLFADARATHHRYKVPAAPVDPIAPRVPAQTAATLVLLAKAPTLIVPSQPPYPVVGSVERLDPALDAILPPDAAMEKLAEGFNWSEGPVWVPVQNALLLSDVPENRVYHWKENEGITVLLDPSGFTGLQFCWLVEHALQRTRAGSLGTTRCSASKGDASVSLEMALDGKRFTETIADRFSGKRLLVVPTTCASTAAVHILFLLPIRPTACPPMKKPEIEFSTASTVNGTGGLASR